MRPIILLFGLLLLCGCACVSKQTTESTQSAPCLYENRCMAKRFSEDTSSPERKPQAEEPYVTYNLETANFQVWFYDNHYVYSDGDNKVTKNYTTIDTDSN